MASVVLNGSVSGSCTITAPSAAGTTTLTLPITSGTVLTSGTNTNFPAGSVLQVVSVNYSTTVNTSGTTYIDTGLSASITPSSASNKILIIVNHACSRKSNGNADNAMDMKIVKNGSDLQQIASSAGYTGTAIFLYFSVNYMYLDSPSTTSSITYKTQFKNQTAAANVSVQTDGSAAPSTITLMEIKG
jgi:hypothetical protein